MSVYEYMHMTGGVCGGVGSPGAGITSGYESVWTFCRTNPSSMVDFPWENVVGAGTNPGPLEERWVLLTSEWFSIHCSFRDLLLLANLEAWLEKEELQQHLGETCHSWGTPTIWSFYLSVQLPMSINTHASLWEQTADFSACESRECLPQSQKQHIISN